METEFKNELKNQCICHEHCVDPCPGYSSHNVGHMKQPDP